MSWINPPYSLTRKIEVYIEIPLLKMSSLYILSGDDCILVGGGKDPVMQPGSLRPESRPFWGSGVQSIKRYKRLGTTLLPLQAGFMAGQPTPP